MTNIDYMMKDGLNLVIAFVAIVGIIIVGGCITEKQPVSNVNASSSAPFFPQQKPGLDGMEALLVGELVLVDDCLRVDEYLLVWPPSFSVSTEDGVIWIIDDNGQPIMRVGDKVKVGGGGGEMPSEHIAKYSAELPSDRCSGPYWIVGEVITKIDAPSLLGSEITKIEAHNGHDVDHLYIHIIDGEAELKIGAYDGNKYIYQSAKKVPVEQILDELNSFTELFNRGMTAEHVEMPLERSMSSDYDIAIYLADGRHYLISQVIDASIQVENKTSKPAQVMFYLKPYSIDYTQPMKDIGVKAFDLQPSIQEKFFDSC